MNKDESNHRVDHLTGEVTVAAGFAAGERGAVAGEAGDGDVAAEALAVGLGGGAMLGGLEVAGEGALGDVADFALVVDAID